ncbi:MAG: hypothetical protein MUF21_03850 [Gemmatimonadaceae bacterium]|nr:hypothetical protein [Gemmatimonadaceae bacterium]
MPRAFRAIALAAGVAVVLAACSDPFAPRPRDTTVTTRFAIGALNAPLPGVPSVWRIGSLATFRLDSLPAQFDLGFDLLPDGRVRVIPAAKVVASIPALAGQALHRVALLPVAGGFDALTIAPERGYLIDSLQVVSPGQVLAVRTESDFCSNDPNGRRELYAKFVIDSTNTTSRRIFINTTVVRSCGYRSFLDTLPAR